MNEFFEKSAEAAKEMSAAAKTITAHAVKKANQSSRCIKLQISKAALRKLLEVQYREMGMLVYEMCRRDINAAEDIASLAAQIDFTKKRISAIDRRMQEVMELIRCPRCGSVVKIKNAFCSHCGCKLAAEEEQMEENENEMIYNAEEE